MSNYKNKQQGFTLIELMITVAVVAILAAVAYPSYQNQLERGYLSEGRVALTSAANLMERCFSTRGSYENCPALGSAIASESGYYSVTVAAKENTFTLSASRVKAVGNNKCGTLTLTQSGVTGVTGTAPWGEARCWGK